MSVAPWLGTLREWGARAFSNFASTHTAASRCEIQGKQGVAVDDGTANPNSRLELRAPKARATVAVQSGDSARGNEFNRARMHDRGKATYRFQEIVRTISSTS